MQSVSDQYKEYSQYPDKIIVQDNKSGNRIVNPELQGSDHQRKQIAAELLQLDDHCYIPKRCGKKKFFSRISRS